MGYGAKDVLEPLCKNLERKIQVSVASNLLSP